MSGSDWNLDITLAQFIAEEVNVPADRAGRVADLFEQGNEVAYVARYRVDQHGGMSCDEVRRIFEVLKEAKEVNKKVEKAMATVKAKAGDEAPHALEKLRSCRDTEDVAEITKMYSTGKKTKAGVARSLGLEQAAGKILAGEAVNIRALVQKSNADLSSIEAVEEHLKCLLADLINKDDAVTAKVKEILEGKTRVDVKIKASLSAKAKKWTEKDKEFGLIKDFQEISTLDIRAKYIQNHQILRILRGEEKGVVSWSVDVTGAEHVHPGNSRRVAPPHINLYTQAKSYSISKLFLPKIQRSVKRSLSNRAEVAAIDCFAKNLGQLFCQEGVKNRHVVALDPGFAACKAAFLAPDGSVIETKQLLFRNCVFDRNGEDLLKKWATVAKTQLVFAVGNGTASFETQKALQNLISRNVFAPTAAQFCVIDECGASKYSITPLAEEELPGMPITEKSAVSLGRRLIDPVSEFVKIEPKHLGIGMYQHSVNEKKLTETLDLVVKDSVSIRGVDANVASLQLLQQVCGLNKKTAAGIITLRKKKGRIASREDLKSVAGLGPKAFQQAAGFLKVTPPDESTDEPPAKKKNKVEYEPLDATTIHPENYKTAKEVLKRAGVATEEIGTARAQEKLRAIQTKSPEEQLVVSLLTSSPKTVPPPPFITEVRKIGSLRPGEVLSGRVTNITDFGAFIDIGAEKAALAHKSVLRPPLPEVGARIQVKVVNVDASRGRIGVTPV